MEKFWEKMMVSWTQTCCDMKKNHMAVYDLHILIYIWLHMIYDVHMMYLIYLYNFIHMLGSFPHVFWTDCRIFRIHGWCPHRAGLGTHNQIQRVVMCQHTPWSWNGLGTQVTLLGTVQKPLKITPLFKLTRQQHNHEGLENDEIRISIGWFWASSGQCSGLLCNMLKLEITELKIGKCEVPSLFLG